MYPDWLLIIQSVIGLLIIIIGLLLLRKIIRITIGIIMIVLIAFLATALNVYIIA